MAKRILALVMILVLSLSVLSVEAFASNNDYTNMNNIQVSHSGTTLNISWNAVSGASTYTVEVLNSSNKRAGGASDIRATSASVNVGAYGDFTINVTAYNNASGLIGGGSKTYTIPYSSTSGGITVSGSATKTTISWTAVAGVSSYYVSWTSSVSSESGAKTVETNSAELDGINVSHLTSVSVRVGNASGYSVGTWTSNGTGSNPSTGTGNVGISGSTLWWNGLGNNQKYSIYYSYNGSSLTWYTTTAVGATSYNVASIINDFLSIYGYYSNAYINFYIYVGERNQTTNLLGSYTYYPYYNNNNGTTGTGSVRATISGSNITVNWNSTGATDYIVVVRVNNYSGGSYSTGGATSITLPITYVTGNTYSITVYNGNTQALIGTVTINANGNVSGGTWNGGSYNNGQYVYGNNCTLVVGTTTSTVTWNNAGVGTYIVMYTNNDTGEMRQSPVYTNSFTIPLGSSNCKSFTVNIINPSNQTAPIIATATYTGSTTSNNGNVTSSTKGLTLTEKNSGTTTVSWAAVANVSYYQIAYGRFDSSTPVEDYTLKTSYDIPYGKSVGYTVTVTAVTTANRVVAVGTATHKAGDAYTTSTPSTDKTETDNTSVYVTGFKGTAGDKKVTLSWKAAKDAKTYDVYWKRSSATEWKKAGSTSKLAANVTGLNNGVSYDFKVVANSRDSGILTGVTPSASGSSTKTAPDPAGAGTATATVPVITSATGGKGTISLSWSGITNGKEYQVWIAPSGSTEYSLAQGGITGTSATITGLSAGTYKVRIKGTTDGTYKKLGDANCIKSDYKSVTVS